VSLARSYKNRVDFLLDICTGYLRHLLHVACRVEHSHMSITASTDHIFDSSTLQSRECSHRPTVAHKLLHHAIALPSIEDAYVTFLVYNVHSVTVGLWLYYLAKELLISNLGIYGGSSLPSEIVFTDISVCGCHAQMVCIEEAHVCVEYWYLQVKLIVGEVSCLPLLLAFR